MTQHSRHNLPLHLHQQQKLNHHNIQNQNHHQAIINSKKVISSLKEEMSNIREGMSKLMRVKSEDVFQINQNMMVKVVNSNQNISRQVVDQENKQIWKPSAYQIKKMQQRIKYLQTENNLLNYKLKQIQNNKKNEKQTYLKKQLQLEMHNKKLQITIDCLKQQIIKIQQLSKKSKKRSNSIKNTIKTIRQNNSIIQLPHLNPQVVKNNNNTVDFQHYEYLVKQNQGIIRGIEKLEHKIKIIEKINMDNVKLIEMLNQKLIKSQISKLSRKYQRNQ